VEGVGGGGLGLVEKGCVLADLPFSSRPNPFPQSPRPNPPSPQSPLNQPLHRLLAMHHARPMADNPRTGNCQDLAKTLPVS